MLPIVITCCAVLLDVTKSYYMLCNVVACYIVFEFFAAMLNVVMCSCMICSVVTCCIVLLNFVQQCYLL